MQYLRATAQLGCPAADGWKNVSLVITSVNNISIADIPGNIEPNRHKLVVYIVYEWDSVGNFTMEVLVELGKIREMYINTLTL